MWCGHKTFKDNEKEMECLSKFQKKIVEECIEVQSGCLCLPMGGGKTIISLVLSQTEARGKTLVVVSKTLIPSWVEQIEKFFGDEFPFEIFYPSDDEFVPETNFVITTPQVVVKYYKKWDLETKFVTKELIEMRNQAPVKVNRYHIPLAPMLKKGQGDQDGRWLFSNNWKFVFIDEMQTYTNAETAWCRALSCLCSKRKWGLSGTPLNEPTPVRVLGYHLLIGEQKFPNSLPEASSFIKSIKFKGLKQTMVLRTAGDKDFSAPPIPDPVETIVEHGLNREEFATYTILKEVIMEIKSKALHFKKAGDETKRKKFSAYILTLIMYTRQFLSCAAVPFRSIAATHEKNPNEMTKLFMEKIKQRGLSSYFASSKSLLSTRIAHVLQVLDQHANERVLVFCCFIPPLHIIESFVKDRPTFVLENSFSPTERGFLLQRFEASKNGVLFLTFSLGAEGLNIQHCSVVLLVDVWWNCGKIQQAIARVLRRGQKKAARIYFYTSQTGIENVLFEKQADKLIVLKELVEGQVTEKVKPMSIDKILQIFNGPENVKILEFVRKIA